ncbi:MAG: tetratricopeptide repeat protein, partial [Bacteroidota bacterium]
MKRYVVFLVFMLSGAILFQGFQCASREFTTAKVAIQNNDWEKGEEYLKKELDKNPGNTEARIMLAEVQQKLKKDEAAVATINKAEETAETPEMKDRIRVFKQNMWVNIYNVGLGFYRAYSSSKKEKFLDSAIAKFQLGAQLRPAMPDFQLQQARLYEIKGDEASAIKYYQNALNLMEDEINFARENNVYLEMPRNEVLAKFGDPAMTRGMSTDQGDSLITDMFQIGDDEVYMFFDENPDTKTFRVMGWRYDPPDTWLDGEKQNPTIIDVSVIAIIAQHHFDNKQLEKALEYTKMLTTVDPTNNEANRFMVQLYQELGRTEQAVEQIRDLTVKYPKNKVYFAQYGDILLTMG